MLYLSLASAPNFAGRIIRQKLHIDRQKHALRDKAIQQQINEKSWFISR